MRIHGVTGDIDKDGILDEKRSKGRNWRQKAAVQRVLEYWRTHGHEKPYPMLALPTGFGKGIIIKRILRQLRHKKILLIVGAKNLLLDQSKQVLIDYAKQESGSTDYSVFPETSGKVVLATWQGLAAAYRRPKGLDVKFGLAIVDEVHNSGTWKRLDILRELAPDAIVGLTATAYRSTGAYKWPHEYGFEIVDAMPLPDCIMKGWLSPMAAIAIDTHVLLPKEVRETNKLNYRKINKALGNHPHLFERIATEIGTRFLPSGMKTVIIVNRIEQEACVIARILKKMGYDVGLAVNQAKSRQLSEEFITTDAISRYKLPPEHTDSIQVLISPQVIGEGFDAPMTECVVWAAPTMSALRYTQVVGRGTRICPGKKFCLIVDFVYMIENFGYSYNFAQFMPIEVLHELPGGIMYVGPENAIPTVQVPSKFTDGPFVSVQKLVTSFYPPAGDWMNAYQLATLTDKSVRWVEYRLERDGAQGEARMSLTGPRVHYPPAVAEKLKLEADGLIPAEGWKTLKGIAREVGRGQGWVEKVIDRLGLVAEDRIDNAGRVWPHFSPEDVERIRCEAEAILPAGDWLCLEDIARSLGRVKSTPWVEARLKELFPNSSETRIARSRVQDLPHYPPEVVEVLRKLQEEGKPAEDWLSIQQIAKQTGKSEPWVKKQLEENFPTSAEKRIGVRVLPSPHYPPGVAEVIKKIADQFPPAGDWKTIRGMAAAIGRSEKWVRTHVEGTPREKLAESRVGMGNVIAPHFPPEVLEGLKRESGPTVPTAGTWLTPTQIAEALGRDQGWVQFKLKALQIKGELRKSLRNNRILPHYPPSAVEDIRKSPRRNNL